MGSLEVLDEISSRNTSFADTLREEEWLVQASLMEKFQKSAWRAELHKQFQQLQEWFKKSGSTEGGVGGFPRLVHWILVELVSKRGLIASYNEFVDPWIAILKRYGLLPASG